MNAPTLVLGIGNVLMGDEGVGVHAVRRLETTDLAVKADFLDGGTGGFQLLGSFDGRERIILIDATMDGRPPGTVALLRPRFASDFPRSLSAHDIGLCDLVESASLLGSLPRIDLVTVSVADVQSLTLDLSPAVAASLDAVESVVRSLLAG